MKPMRGMVIATLVVSTSLFAQTPGSGQGGGGGKNQRQRAQSAAKPTQIGQQIPCPKQEELVPIPELITSNGRLRATVTVESEKQRIPFRYQGDISATSPGNKPAAPGTFSACFEQWVRAFRTPDGVPAYPGPPAPGKYLDPMAGPTLRAEVGDVIELAFINKIDPSNFGDSIDRGDQGTGDCDQAGLNGSIYPGQNGDTYPDCFHGSTTANLHFHGTHTNPNTTGDNVFLEIVSNKRLKDEPTPDTSKFRNAVFDAFFNKCEGILQKGSHVEYPRSWSDLPGLYTKDQERLLKKYDQLPGIGKKLWPVDEHQIAQGAWPQYYLGAFPYCFRLPTDPGTTPSTTAAAALPHTHGAGTAELGDSTDFNQGAVSPNLIMGQAPGLHWYHAHKHGSTNIDVANGMTGAFIIEGPYDEAISAYYDPTNAASNQNANPPNVYPTTVTWTRKQPTMVINQIGGSPNLILGGPPNGQDKGPDFSVNGRLNPFLTMQPGEVKMLRIVNTSSRASVYFIGPPAGFHWKQIAQDGVQFNQYNWTNRNNDQSFLLAPGNRADLLFQAPATPCTNTTVNGCQFPVQVYNEVDPTDLLPANGKPQVYKINLFTVNIKGAPLSPAMTIMQTAPAFPGFLADIPDSAVKLTRQVQFASVPPPPPAIPATGQHTIDGHLFNGEVGEVVLLNTVEEWKVLNASANPNISHPFHIHINPFQITEVFSPNEMLNATTPKYVTSLTPALQPGQCYLNPDDPATWRPQNYNATTGKCEFVPPVSNPQNMIWWDTFPIPSGIAGTKADGTAIVIPGYFKMRSRFVDFAGYYVIHCHILAHEDRGMMTVVEVAPIISPYSHH